MLRRTMFIQYKQTQFGWGWKIDPREGEFYYLNIATYVWYYTIKTLREWT